MKWDQNADTWFGRSVLQMVTIFFNVIRFRLSLDLMDKSVIFIFFFLFSSITNGNRMPTLCFHWIIFVIVTGTHILINEMHRVNIHQITDEPKKKTDHNTRMKSVRQWNILKIPIIFRFSFACVSFTECTKWFSAIFSAAVASTFSVFSF